MTPSQKLTALRAAIVEVVPSIMELKFGCLIEKDGEIYQLAIANDRGVFEKITQDYWCCVDQAGQAYSLKKHERATVLGRDITLEDVLMAIGKREVLPWEGMNISSMSILCLNNGTFALDNGSAYAHLAQWKLNIPLHLQTPETIDFLYGILVEKV